MSCNGLDIGGVASGPAVDSNLIVTSQSFVEQDSVGERQEHTMAEEPEWGDTIHLSVTRGGGFRETTIMRNMEGGQTRDKNLSQARKLIEAEGSSAGIVTMEKLQKLLNNNEFCEILYNLFNEGGDEPLKQSDWFDKMKAWTEVVFIFKSFDGSTYVSGDTRNDTDEGADEEDGPGGLD